MKKILLILFMFLISIRIVYAPIDDRGKKPKPEFVDPMLYAFELIESAFDTDTINKLGYGGILQIGQEMIDEANRICRIKKLKYYFILNDRLNKEKSELIWTIVQEFHNPNYHLSPACKIWNPLANKQYYIKIRSEMINAIYTNIIINDIYKTL